MTTRASMKDIFGFDINPGDSFLRVEARMSASSMRYYFFAGFADDGRIHVQEYGKIPRVIKEPYVKELILLNDGQLNALGYTERPTVDEVRDPATQKSKAKRSQQPITI